MTTAPGTDVVLGTRYRLVSRIAAGGMGEVWSATDEVLGRNVAVKVLRREYADDPEFQQRFRAEARHTAGLSHAGIAAVYDYHDGSPAGDSGSQSPFIVMENVPGEPLSTLIAREGALPSDRTLDVVAQTALALQAAHDAGVIHRDVKPGNILLMPDGHVKITDFGISRAVDSAPLTATGAIMGTAFYLSPEQASGKVVTASTDVYSLGVVAYECLAGHRPFAGETPVAVALAHLRDQPADLGSEVRPEVSALVMRMLAKDPAARPSSAGALAREALDLRATLFTPLAATRLMDVSDTSIMDASDTAARSVADADARTVADADERTVALPKPALGKRDAQTDPGFHLPAPGRTPRWLPYAVALAACALVLLFLVHSCGNGSQVAATSTPTPKASATAPVLLLVRAADYVGKPVADATAALRALGLTVAVRPVATAPGTTIGSVTAVTPTGELSPDQTVTLEVAQVPAAKNHGHPPKRHKNPGKKG